MSPPTSALSSHLIRQASTSPLCCLHPLTAVLSHWPVLSPSHRALCLYLPGSLTAPHPPLRGDRLPIRNAAVASPPTTTFPPLFLHHHQPNLLRNQNLRLWLFFFCKLPISITLFFLILSRCRFFFPSDLLLIYIFTSFSFVLLLTLNFSRWGPDKIEHNLSGCCCDPHNWLLEGCWKRYWQGKTAKKSLINLQTIWGVYTFDLFFYIMPKLLGSFVWMVSKVLKRNIALWVAYSLQVSKPVSLLGSISSAYFILHPEWSDYKWTGVNGSKMHRWCIWDMIAQTTFWGGLGHMWPHSFDSVNANGPHGHALKQQE